MSNINDFVIENGELKEYSGNDANVVIPDDGSVKYLGEECFYGCDSVESITIPEGVTRIEDRAFLECENLTEIKLPESLLWIGEAAFAECKKLASINIPNNIPYISASTFSQCTSLTAVSIGESVQTIYVSAFSGCSSLSSLTLPKNLSFIEAPVFDGCTSLREICISSDNPYFRNDSEGGLVSTESNSDYSNSVWLIWVPKNEKKLYSLDKDIEVLNTNVFDECQSLKAIICDIDSQAQTAKMLNTVAPHLELFVRDRDRVIFSDDLERLVKVPEDYSSFLSSGIYHIPSFVSVIGAVAFNGCTKISKIYIHNNITAIRRGAFDRCENAVLVVYKDSIGEKYAKYFNLPFEYID